MAVQIQLRRDTAANWTSTNPTLAQGEIGFETDTNRLKWGDGSTAWATLAYYGACSPASLADHGWQGDATYAIAGTALTIGQICYQGSDGKMELADADATTSMPALYMALGTISENATGLFLTKGYLRDDSLFSWATVGGVLYVGNAAGAMVQTAPSGTGDSVQAVGNAWSADIVYFNPSLPAVVLV